MGRASAEDFARTADLSAGLRWHLLANHYPPIPAELVPACIKAINACAFGDHRESVKLPRCVKYRDQQECPAYALVEFAHLEPWVDRLRGHAYEYDYDDGDGDGGEF